ncbi:hypothetical protein B4135_3708 [Caldibacillus debilis]|uniref:Uncharacterized protein n=1 Tax=Caldibacillus debilis TaxID=301148 RepID=A0A150LAS9_9BACI|nr:hypothetical protein B4135_3708 [Caldibacillus debilis]
MQTGIILAGGRGRPGEEFAHPAPPVSRREKVSGRGPFLRKALPAARFLKKTGTVGSCRGRPDH